MRINICLASEACERPGHEGLEFTVLHSRPGRLHTPLAKSTRPAFTLIELIIVIAIIAVLAALTTGVAMRFYGIQASAFPFRFPESSPSRIPPSCGR